MTRRRHAHRQSTPVDRRAIAVLAIGVAIVLAWVPGQGRASRPDANAVALVRHPGAIAGATAPLGAARPAPWTPSIVPSLPPSSAGFDTSGGDTSAADPTRPAVSVPAPEAKVLVGPGRGATAVFLGDSYTSGWHGAGIGSRGWPRIVDGARGWKTINLAVPGTGFLNPGWTDQPIGSLVGRAVKAHPDVIVLAGGHNDSRWSVAATARAADAVIDRLRRAEPEAVLVIVAPIWANGSPPRRCLDLRDHLRRKAAAVGAVFVDPLADRWFAGSSHRLIGPDGIHPTYAGHRFIADRVLEALAGA
jgi:lysophospholipase L1-like esterase